MSDAHLSGADCAWFFGVKAAVDYNIFDDGSSESVAEIAALDLCVVLRCESSS